jgi:DNA ligase-1
MGKMSVILLSDYKVTDSPKEIEDYFHNQLEKGLEGIMAKKLDGTYRAGARDFNWIKYKKSYVTKLNDTIDAVVMGFDRGQGKRMGFGIGDFLIGVLDEKNEMFVTVAKIGTGLTDIEWKTLKVTADKLKVTNKPKNYNVDKMMECDVWVEPEIVVEIRADEITRSPVHTAGRVLKRSKSGGSWEVDVAGLALRFPRLERFREDKKPQDATTVAEVKKMYKMQGKK